MLQDITSIKETQSAQRGSGLYSDEAWFHGSSLCISGTVYYSTIVVSGITYGKITDVFVSCRVINGTVLDNISLVVGQMGFKPEGGYERQFETTRNNVANNTTENVANDLPYTKWDETSYANARITATVHRGTSSQKSYTFSIPVLGDV